MTKPHETIDAFLGGKMQIIQSDKGYRFSSDALLLAEFVSLKEQDYVVDLGSGCGIILLFLALNQGAGFFFGLELQEELASQARRNVELNNLGKKITIIRADLRHLPLNPGFADVVICNPPYRKGGSGRINPYQSRAIARHEIAANLDDILIASRKLLKSGGKLNIIYTASRLTEIFAKMRNYRIEPKRLQIIYPDSSSHAKLAMIDGRLYGKSGLKILPPVFGQGNFSIF